MSYAAEAIRAMHHECICSNVADHYNETMNEYQFELEILNTVVSIIKITLSVVL